MREALQALVAGATVVTANERLARALKLAFNHSQRRAGRQAWRTARVFSWSAWLDDLWLASLNSDTVASRGHLLGPGQEQALWQESLARSGVESLPGQMGALSRLASRTWRVCQQWRVGTRALRDAADTDDTRAFAAWAARYEERCAGEGWLDAGMLPARLGAGIRAGRLSLPAQLCFSGFVEWTPLQRELLRQVAAVSEVAETGPPLADNKMRGRLLLRDKRDELEMAARWARAHLEADPLASVAMVVPDLSRRLAEVRREVLDIFDAQWRLAPERLSAVNFSLGEPLTNRGLVDIALLLLEALGGRLDHGRISQLLRTRHVAGGIDESAARARLELQCRQQPGATLSLEWLAEAATGTAPSLAALLHRLQVLARAQPGRQAPAQWAAAFRQALRDAGWPGEKGIGSDEYQVVVALESVLDQFAASTLLAGLIGRAEAVTRLTEQLRQQLFQPAGSPQGLQVLGILEAVGQQFDALWLCGLTSEEWPPATRPTPLVALNLQRRLRMPDSSPALARERAERVLRWLEGAAVQTVVSCAQFEGEARLTPSPLIAHVPEIVAAKLPLWPTPRYRETLFAARAGEVLTPDPVPPLGAAEHDLRGGAALLERQAQCPARAFIEFRLGASELPSPATGLDARGRGLLLHAILQRFYERVSDQRALCALDPRDEVRLIDELLDAEVPKRLPGHDPLLRALGALERGRLRHLLGSFFAGERTRNPFRVLAAERSLTGLGGPPALQRLGLRLRIDRIDELEDGRRLVIDYKTGALPTGTQLLSPPVRQPQLPLYAICADADAVAMVQLRAGRVRWVGVGRGSWGIEGVDAPEGFSAGRFADWQALKAFWWSMVERLAGAFADGDFRVDRWHLEPARGQWLMATRVYDLDADEDERA
jgi:probable DNA repair protein